MCNMCQQYDVDFLSERLAENEAGHGDNYSQPARLRERVARLRLWRTFPRLRSLTIE